MIPQFITKTRAGTSALPQMPNGYLAECTRCIVTEERNGIYELELDYPVTGKWYESLISGDAMIAAWHDDNHDRQPFDVYAYSAPLDGIVTFYARHRTYRFGEKVVKSIDASNAQTAMAQIMARAVPNGGVLLVSQMTGSSSMKTTVPMNGLDILQGTEGSYLDTYGGEIGRDDRTITFFPARGIDTDVTIRYGKNLMAITKDYDESGIFTAIAPYWTDGETVVSLTNVYVLASGATKTIIRALDMSGDFEEAPTEAQLQAAAEAWLVKNTPWNPTETIEVDFAQLWQTPEYEDVYALERCRLCDTVSVYFPELGVTSERVKIVKVVYDVLLERYESMELGQLKKTYAQTIMESVSNEVNKTATETRAFTATAVENATNLITGGLGGYVVFTRNANGEPQEILIMDTDDIMTAQHVIRLNQNGIGFSTTGYQGPYTNAWTIDGALVADFITTGTLNANLIRVGTISDVPGNNYWDLVNGILSLSGYATDSDVSGSAGGNLLPKTGDFSGWVAALGVAGDGYVLDPTNHEVDLTATTSAEYVWWTAGQRFSLEAGEKYTLSLLMKSNGYVAGVDVFIHDSGWTAAQVHTFSELSTEWTLYTWTLTIPASASGLEWEFRIDNNGTTTPGQSAVLYVKNLKLEKGELATDWTPAWSDYSTSSDLATSGKTTINGGNIITGSLSADKILGGILTVGGLNNANGQIQVLDASGNVIGSWTKDGIVLSAGTISSADGTTSIDLNNNTVILDSSDGEWRVELSINYDSSTQRYDLLRVYRKVSGAWYLQGGFYGASGELWLTAGRTSFGNLGVDINGADWVYDSGLGKYVLAKL